MKCAGGLICACQNFVHQVATPGLHPAPQKQAQIQVCRVLEALASLCTRRLRLEVLLRLRLLRGRPCRWEVRQQGSAVE